MVTAAIWLQLCSTGCYIAVTIWQSSVDVKGLNKITNDMVSTTPGNPGNILQFKNPPENP